VDSGQADTPDLAAMIDRYEFVDVRMALIRATDRWQVVHAEVTLDSTSPAGSRTWRYAEEIFLERRLLARTVAGLLRKEPQELDGLKVVVSAPMPSCTFQRLAGQVEWSRLTTPWPRTEWSISPAEQMPNRQGRLLVGDGPAFLNFEAAYSSFFHGAPPSNLANQQQLWRIIRIDQRAWLHTVTVAPDMLTIVAKGTQLTGVTVELSSPASWMVRPVGRTGKVRLRLPKGLAHSSLLMLRRDDDWLDYRYFLSPVPGREPGASVIWDQPGADLGILVAGGEGQYVEFKQEIPVTAESKRNVLKTVAAFASGEGGTVLFGVTDDAQVVGIGPATLDRQMVAVSSMIRDSIDPDPPYILRAAELDGKTLLLVEVASGGRWYALNPVKPEFYVRRGASTVPARMAEIAAGFGQGQSPPDSSLW
jgi:hypothetical protein